MVRNTTYGRDHGGGIDAARRRFGGERIDWLDLSTGINPVPYPFAPLSENTWAALPDTGGMTELLHAARAFWHVPDAATVLAAPGTSSLIARLPVLSPARDVRIPEPTYNEHAASFAAAGRPVRPNSAAQVLVHPNNPDGKLWSEKEIMTRHERFTVIDESFCDLHPEKSHVALSARPGVVVLKSFGKFWGLAGLRLGFAIAHPETLTAKAGPDLASWLGPWPVAGPALAIGVQALKDHTWARETRARLAREAQRLDGLLASRGASVVGGTDLFRLYEVADASAWQQALARHHVWSRRFPYSETWLRLGLPAPDRWAQLEHALKGLGT